MSTASARLRAARRAQPPSPDGVAVLPPAALFARALRDPGTRLRAVTSEGETIALPVARWLGPPTTAELDALAGVRGPALDVGCGPGRHVASLHRRGVLAVGVELASEAARMARARGALVIEGSVFSPLPHEGGWGTVLLLDGNVGIGGRPRTLLRRIRTLLAADGEALVETEAPGTALGLHEVRLEAEGEVSAWFPWARVGLDALGDLAATAGMEVRACWEREGRWFARLAPHVDGLAA